MSDTSAREQLVDQLESDGDAYFSSGFSNNILDLSLTILTVLASLVATVLASTNPQAVSRWIVAGVAAIPAAAASLQRIVAIRERSNWYFSYAARVRALATQLRYAKSPDIEDFGKRYADLAIEMEREWIRIGHSGAAPGRQSAGRGAGSR